MKKFKNSAVAVLIICLLFPFVSCSRNNGGSSADEPLTAKVNVVYEDGVTAEMLRANPENFLERQQDTYGMDEVSAKSFIKDTNKWQVYNVEVLINNATSDDLMFYFIESESNGKSGIFIGRESIDGEFGVPAGVKDVTYNVSFIVNIENRTPQQVLSDVNAIDFTLRYSSKPAVSDEDKIDESNLLSLYIKGLGSDGEATAAGGKDGAGSDKDTSKGDGLATSELSASKSDASLYSDMLEVYRKNPRAFASESENFGFAHDDAEDILGDKGYKIYRLNISLKNNSTHDLTIYNTLSASNGKDGIYVNRVSEYGEFSIAGGSEQVMPVTVLVKTSGRSDDECIGDILSLKLTLEYSKTPTINASGLESIEEIKTLAVA